MQNDEFSFPLPLTQEWERIAIAEIIAIAFGLTHGEFQSPDSFTAKLYDLTATLNPESLYLYMNAVPIESQET